MQTFNTYKSNENKTKHDFLFGVIIFIFFLFCNSCKKDFAKNLNGFEMIETIQNTGSINNYQIQDNPVEIEVQGMDLSGNNSYLNLSFVTTNVLPDYATIEISGSGVIAASNSIYMANGSQTHTIPIVLNGTHGSTIIAKLKYNSITYNLGSLQYYYGRYSGIYTVPNLEDHITVDLKVAPYYGGKYSVTATYHWPKVNHADDPYNPQNILTIQGKAEDDIVRTKVDIKHGEAVQVFLVSYSSFLFGAFASVGNTYLWEDLEYNNYAPWRPMRFPYSYSITQDTYQGVSVPYKNFPELN